MKNFLSTCVLSAAGLFLSACATQPKEEPIDSVIERGLKTATDQALLMAKELENQDGKLPKSMKMVSWKSVIIVGGAVAFSLVNCGIYMKQIRHLN